MQTDRLFIRPITEEDKIVFVGNEGIIIFALFDWMDWFGIVVCIVSVGSKFSIVSKFVYVVSIFGYVEVIIIGSISELWLLVLFSI